MSNGKGPMEGRTDGLDLYSQATKALSVRCPYEAEEAPKDPSLPSTLASFLERHLDGRKNSHKKAEEPSDKPLPPPPPDKVTVWDQTEEYFRPITVPDIQNLLPKQLLDDVQLDSCFSFPGFGTSAENVEKDLSFESNTVGPSSDATMFPQESVAIEQDIKKNAIDVADANPTSAPPMPEAVPEEEEQEDGTSSLHWILGSRERFVLTSERPNKKHKLLDKKQV